MSTPVLIAILFAALLHAAWNALLKSQPDKMAGALAVSMGSALMGLACLVYTGLPAREAWPLVASSAVLHTGYFLFLTSAYRVGDLSQVYPIARGVAPLITAAAAGVVLGETLTPLETAAVATIGLGLISLVLTAKTDGRLNVVSCTLALVTGVFISAYSLNDGVGARVAGDSVEGVRLAPLKRSDAQRSLNRFFRLETREGEPLAAPVWEALYRPELPHRNEGFSFALYFGDKTVPQGHADFFDWSGRGRWRVYLDPALWSTPQEKALFMALLRQARGYSQLGIMLGSTPHHEAARKFTRDLGLVERDTERMLMIKPLE